jgi:hypothetical protein
MATRLVQWPALRKFFFRVRNGARLTHAKPVMSAAAKESRHFADSGAFVVSNLGEWQIDKRIVHRRWKPLATLYDQHTAMHHRIYELCHLAYHLPRDGIVGRRWLVGVLREHHALHHDPRLMQRWTFNVIVPFADWVLRSIAPRDLVAGVRARRSAAAADQD